MKINKKFIFVIVCIILLFFIIISLRNYNIIFVGHDVLGNARANFSIMANASTDFFAPSITIINPDGIFTNQTVPVLVVFDDNQILDSCWFNITTTSGILIGDIFNRLNCTGLQGTFTTDRNDTFYFFAFANDTANNRNVSNSTFTVNGTATPSQNVTNAPENRSNVEGRKGVELFSIKPKSFKFNLVLDETVFAELNILDQAQAKLKFYISVEDLEDFITLKEREFELNTGEQKVLQFYVFGKKLGVFTGKINVLGGKTLKEVPIIIQVESKERFFDVKVNLKDDSKVIRDKNEVTAKVKITALKKTYPLYSEVYYTIKDFKGNIIAQERESNVLIDNVKNFEKTLKLPPGIKDGSYIFIVQINNLDSVAADSDFFIVNKQNILFETPLEITIPKTSTLIYLLIIAILIVITHYTILSKKKSKSSS